MFINFSVDASMYISTNFVFVFRMKALKKTPQEIKINWRNFYYFPGCKNSPKSTIPYHKPILYTYLVFYCPAWDWKPFQSCLQKLIMNYIPAVNQVKSLVACFAIFMTDPKSDIPSCIKRMLILWHTQLTSKSILLNKNLQFYHSMLINFLVEKLRFFLHENMEYCQKMAQSAQKQLGARFIYKFL